MKGDDAYQGSRGGLYPDGTILQAQDGDEVKYAPFVGGEDGALAVLFQTVDARESDVRATGMVRDCEFASARIFAMPSDT